MIYYSGSDSRLWWSPGPFYESYSWNKNKSLWTFTHFITQTHKSVSVLYLWLDSYPRQWSPPYQSRTLWHLGFCPAHSNLTPLESRHPDQFLTRGWSYVVDTITCPSILYPLLLLLFSCPVVSNSLWPYQLQHTRPPCHSPSPRVWSNSCPLHQWCHTAISSSDTLFFCPQPFPASRTFPVN